MSMFVDYVNKIDTSEKEWIIKKAVMTHFLFVYIHPFGDWNWRTARFLMNHVLWSEKLDWITILSDRKKEYIESLKKASENEDISDFTNLITYYLKQK
jgi:Fic family protein